MTRAIRRMSLVLTVLLVALMINITLIQVFRSDGYRARADNQRVLLDEYGRERGPILTGPEAVAFSKDTPGCTQMAARLSRGGKVRLRDGLLLHRLRRDRA